MDYNGIIKSKGEYIMAKYISIFLLCLTVSFVIFSLVGSFGGDNIAETAIFMFGTVTVVLLSFLISLIYYLIGLLKKKL
jgi:hypothetical protein